MKDSPISYLACPYTFTHPDPAISKAVQAARYRAVTKTASVMFNQGVTVFSPITHSHPIAEYGAPGDWKTWEAFDEFLLKQCNRIYVLTLNGWKESTGVTHEINIAQQNDIPVDYLVPAPNVWDLRCPWCNISFYRTDQLLAHPVYCAHKACCEQHK